MPIYRCPKCGREVVKPKGFYYCSVCGPSAIMYEVPPKRRRREAIKPFEAMSDAEVVSALERLLNACPVEDIKDYLSELDRRFPEGVYVGSEKVDFWRLRMDFHDANYKIDRVLEALKRELRKGA